jgi:hypothetical protein
LQKSCALTAPPSMPKSKNMAWRSKQYQFSCPF